MRFMRVNVEVTNICGLACSFCPPKSQPSKVLSLDSYEQVLKELKPYTKRLALHLMGDSLTLSNLNEYLSLSLKYQYEIEISTSGYYLSKHTAKDLLSEPVRQLNISLNSFNKNSLNISFESYMQSVFDLCEEKLQNYPKPFINLRLWNLDSSYKDSEFNEMLFEKLEKFFNIKIERDNNLLSKRVRLESKIVLDFESYFEWPSLESSHSTQGRCHGLSSHIGILASGVVVPCCLDGDGIIELGNIKEDSLKNILQNKRAQNIINGFKENKAVEELCMKCSYKDRFN